MVLDTLSIYAHNWSVAESYGRIARELANELEAMGCYVNRIGPGAPRTQPLRVVMGGIALGYPTMMDGYGRLFAAGPRVWLTMFESDTLPFLWADILNETDQVVVPSRFLLDVFQQSGVEAPVTCIPLGMSKAFQPMERVRSADDPYTFLAIGDRGERKAWDKAGFAFVQAFGDDMRYKLIFKAREGGFNLVVANPNMEWINADLTDDEMVGLYQRADCMISPGREGFNFPAREFVATGGTSVALNWGGSADDLPHWGLPVAVEKMESAWRGHPKLQGVGQWAVPNTEDMAATLRHIAAHRDYYRERGREASRFVRDTYTWSGFAGQMYAVWKEACSGKRTLRHAV